MNVRVYPSACHAPCSVRVTIDTPPDPDSESLIVELESTAFFRRSLIDLEGMNSPRSHVIELRSLPAGTYEVRAMVTRDNDEHSIDRIPLHVAGVRPPAS